MAAQKPANKTTGDGTAVAPAGTLKCTLLNQAAFKCSQVPRAFHTRKKNRGTQPLFEMHLKRLSA